MGTGNRQDALTPHKVDLPAGVKVLSASAGEQFSAIVALDDSDGVVFDQQFLYTWGGNIYGMAL